MSEIQKLIDSKKIQKPNNNIDLIKNSEFDFLPPKPILKWVGGKTQILEKIIGEFPKNINNYHEIFLGGGSVLFGVLYLVKNKVININGTINAYDLNNNLINMYKIIQTKPIELYKEIKKLIDDYNSINDGASDEPKNKNPKSKEEGIISKESYYFWIRKQYNKSDKNDTLIKKSAMFIFLNKTCFRGLYRVGPNGFNVPYGNYKNPSIIDESHLMEISKLIRDVNFYHMSFSDSLKNLIETTDSDKNDFIYMDPPYAPENDKSFVKYTGDGFGIDKHQELFKKCNELHKLKIKWMMSNADVELVRTSLIGFNIESIDCKRSINSKNPGAKTKEVIVKSY